MTKAVETYWPEMNSILIYLKNGYKYEVFEIPT